MLHNENSSRQILNYTKKKVKYQLLGKIQFILGIIKLELCDCIKTKNRLEKKSKIDCTLFTQISLLFMFLFN